MGLHLRKEQVPSFPAGLDAEGGPPHDRQWAYLCEERLSNLRKYTVPHAPQHMTKCCLEKAGLARRDQALGAKGAPHTHTLPERPNADLTAADE